MKCLHQERKIQKVYLCISFLTLPEKEELMLLLGINFIVKEIITIHLWMWSIAAQSAGCARMGYAWWAALLSAL